MGRPSISEQRRIEIGRALQACMIKNGSYELTSVKDIAQEAGLANGLIHHYFTTKDEILMLIADAALLSTTNMIEDLLHTRDYDARREKLHEFLADQDQNRFLLMIYSLSLSMPEIKELITKRHAELKDTLTSRLRRRSDFHEDAEEKASELAFLLESAAMQAALSDSPTLEHVLNKALQATFPIAKE